MLVGVVKAVIDRGHHRTAGTEVGAQRNVAAIGVLAGLQVGEDIRAAKSVDGLLGIANQQYGAVAAGR